MRINNIELYNIGSYEGYNDFNIKSQGLSGNIVVVGGKNGAGKTTLFTAIKLCLYGCKENGYQSMSPSYKREIKRLINDKAKAENNANAYIMLDLDILNGQDWDQYKLKREWSIENQLFENYTVIKNGKELNEEEKVDFDNFLMNILPPELFDLYFFDGEQIADFFLENSNNERIKQAFLTICGYDTFDIIYKNFLRVSKQSGSEGDPTLAYFESENALHDIESELNECQKEIQSINDAIENEDTRLKDLEIAYRSTGGVYAEEWDRKILQLKSEEKIREEKNAWVKNAANDFIPYIILNRELQSLLERINAEKEAERMHVLKELLLSMIPNALNTVAGRYSELNEEIRNSILDEILHESNIDDIQMILNLSKEEFQRLISIIISLLSIDKKTIIAARKEINESVARSQRIRDELEKSSLEGIDAYLGDKEQCINHKLELVNRREILFRKHEEIKEDLETAKVSYAKASKDLEKHFKSQSVTALTGKAMVFLESLQKKLYDSEISKVKELFMYKIRQLISKEQFIDRIEIDDAFNIHVYKQVALEIEGIQNKIKSEGTEGYLLEYGYVHCEDLLEKTGFDSLESFANAETYSAKKVNVLMEFDKATMSKGEKQVFIMALYWSMMQLCKNEVPFIIDTPFARIDTNHREHITEFFFKELHGQVFIFSTDEEITNRHIDLIGGKLGGKFLIENINNTKTSIIAGKYFGE